jgi:hypothetical protein
MNNRFISSAILSCILLVFFSCAPSIKILPEFSDPSYSVGQVSSGSKVRLCMAESVNVMEFKNSYEKEYNSDQQFVQTVQKQAADAMHSVLGCTVSLNSNPQDAVSLTVTQTPAEMEVLFGSATDDFFFVIKGVEISNKRSGVVMMAGGGMGGNTESCVVTMKAELWNVKEKKRVLAYDAIGQAKVTMLFYGTALKEAVGDAIDNMIKYLKTGVTQ